MCAVPGVRTDSFPSGMHQGSERPAHSSAPSWSPARGAVWQCSASWWRTTLARDLGSVCSASDVFVRSAVLCTHLLLVLLLLSEPSEGVHCYVSVTCPPSPTPTIAPSLRGAERLLLAAASRNATSSVVSAEMWDAARGETLIEAKLWHRHHRRKRSCSKVSVPKSAARVSRTSLWDAQLRGEWAQINASDSTENIPTELCRFQVRGFFLFSCNFILKIERFVMFFCTNIWISCYGKKYLNLMKLLDLFWQKQYIFPPDPLY